MTMTVDLGPRLERVVEDLVREGRYRSWNEVLKDGVRLIRDRETRAAALQAAIEVGLADVEAGRIFTVEEVFAEVEARHMGPGT